MEKKRIAIVGSGITGLGALYALRNTPHEVHLFEAADRLGGHTNTVQFAYKDRKTPVDTGFIVLNTATYPNFIAFLKELNVEIVETAMTFGVSRDEGAFEWAGTSLGAVFAQQENLFNPSHWRMIFDIIRFNQFALDLLKDDAHVDLDLSIGEYLDREGYSASFRDDYLIPMTACVWSTGADKCALEFPALTLIRFLWNHHLLSTISERPPWLTVKNGSRTYINAVMRDFPSEQVHLSSPVKSVTNEDDKVVLELKSGHKELFDDVILACHGNQARDIISASATAEEKEIMGAFHTTPNTVFLHSDLSLMPRREIAWSSWNYLTTSSQQLSKSRPSNPRAPNATSSGALNSVSLTYNMNILQHIPVSEFGHVLVTMNPPHMPKPELTQAAIQYAHPLYTAAAVKSQELLPKIQGKRGIWYAGAWTGYGFHEDGFTSGINVACEGLGGNVPWKRVETKFIRGKMPQFTMKDYIVRVIIALGMILIRLYGTALSLAGLGESRTVQKKVA
ncbi:Amine oxidase [Macrophomina phaseolina MS6]|uniref:Amine oxidase n=1 Tax=Macrophomina phaseolina (strain MS6) TaxID=1126212 RepID=K2QMN8_MACPH|nr:Amine oxidase [Macrophomina phaseolina MS6]